MQLSSRLLLLQAVEDSADFVFDYYAAADADEVDAESDIANMPVIQVSFALLCVCILHDGCRSAQPVSKKTRVCLLQCMDGCPCCVVTQHV